jgi:2'-5' RNA ligase
VIESAERAAASVARFELEVDTLGPLPATGPARLIAALARAPRELVELRSRLVARLASQRHRPGSLTPHLTLCRFQAPVRLELREHEIAPASFEVDALSLQQSTLRPNGAEHRQVARIELRDRR